MVPLRIAVGPAAVPFVEDPCLRRPQLLSPSRHVVVLLLDPLAAVTLPRIGLPPLEAITLFQASVERVSRVLSGTRPADGLFAGLLAGLSKLLGGLHRLVRRLVRRLGLASPEQLVRRGRRPGSKNWHIELRLILRLVCVPVLDYHGHPLFVWTAVLHAPVELVLRECMIVHALFRLLPVWASTTSPNAVHEITEVKVLVLIQAEVLQGPQVCVRIFVQKHRTIVNRLSSEEGGVRRAPARPLTACRTKRCRAPWVLGLVGLFDCLRSALLSYNGLFLTWRNLFELLWRGRRALGRGRGSCNWLDFNHRIHVARRTRRLLRLL